MPLKKYVCLTSECVTISQQHQHNVMSHILNCTSSNRTADGTLAFFFTNTVWDKDSWYWHHQAGQISQVCVCETAHASRAFLLCDSMLYNRMEGDEESSEVLTDNADSAPSIGMPAMVVQSLSVILINGIASLWQWCLSLKSLVKVSAYYCRSIWQVL